MSNEESRAMPTVDAVKLAVAEKKIAELEEKIANAQPVETYAFEPKPNTPLWASLLVGMCGAMAPAALTLVAPPWGIGVAVLLGGIAAGVGTHFGIKSAGVKTSNGK